jgi:hypothetical protein
MTNGPPRRRSTRTRPAPRWKADVHPAASRSRRRPYTRLPQSRPLSTRLPSRSCPCATRADDPLSRIATEPVSSLASVVSRRAGHDGSGPPATSSGRRRHAPLPDGSQKRTPNGARRNRLSDCASLTCCCVVELRRFELLTLDANCGQAVGLGTVRSQTYPISCAWPSSDAVVAVLRCCTAELAQR